MRSCLYAGVIRHTRVAPLRHDFVVPALYLSIELAELPELDRLRLFGHNRLGLVTLRDRDHLHPGDAPLATKLARLLEGSAIGGDVTAIRMVTMARVLGVGFNPVSFYQLLRADGSLRGAVVEVNNTYGERHAYVLDGEGAVPGPDGTLRLAAQKRFFVSPFNDLLGEYHFGLTPPGERLGLTIDLHRKDRLVLHTRLTGERRSLDDRSLAAAVARTPLAAALAWSRIAWQALRLRGKGLKPLLKPRPTDARTLRGRVESRS
jgi:uncharacterized protein